MQQEKKQPFLSGGVGGAKRRFILRVGEEKKGKRRLAENVENRDACGADGLQQRGQRADVFVQNCQRTEALPQRDLFCLFPQGFGCGMEGAGLC